jgi:hypothetical protein
VNHQRPSEIEYRSSNLKLSSIINSGFQGNTYMNNFTPTSNSTFLVSSSKTGNNNGKEFKIIAK